MAPIKIRQLTFWAILGAAICCRAAPAATPEQIDNAIARGVKFLYGKFDNDKIWERFGAPDMHMDRSNVGGLQWGGQSALATLTLLGADEDPAKEPRLAKAIDFLRQATLRGNYAVAMRAQVWPLLPMTSDNKACIRRDCDLLLRSLHPDGFYGYYTAGFGTADDWHWRDHSNAQLSVLGVWSLAETYVVEIPESYWISVDHAWRAQQWADGAWSYRNEDPQNGAFSKHSMTMTPAGVATLLITQDWLHSSTDCHGNAPDPNVAAGIKFMIDHMDESYGYTVMGSLGDLPKNLKYYGLYGVERVGVASGRKYLGTIDWFKAASDRLIAEQGRDGGWDGEVPTSCMALLVLIHGRAPVLLNKLEYNLNRRGDTPKPADWDQRSRDAANIARWIGHGEELHFNWQIVNLDVPVDELHDAPILYIAGDQSIDFTEDEYAKLKQFVEDGGLIVFNADCASRMFTAAARRIGTQLFPQCEFRELPADHTIYTEEQYPRQKWKTKPHILGLSNGARELMIILPDDPARLWQTRAYGGHEEMHEVAADIFQYMVTSPQLLKRGKTFIVRPDGPGGGPAVKVARLQYAGYWDPEPAGWRRLAAILHNQKRAELSVQTINLGDGKLTGYKVAHLTGTYAVKLSDAAAAEIKQFVTGGGTLIVDACGGSVTFADAMEKQLNEIFAHTGALPIIDAGNALYVAGDKIDKVAYTRFAAKTLGKLHAPRLRGLEINGRVAVIFSREDLSLGLVGAPIDGIVGYDSASAVRLMANVISYGVGLYATTQPAVHASAAVVANLPAPPHADVTPEVQDELTSEFEAALTHPADPGSAALPDAQRDYFRKHPAEAANFLDRKLRSDNPAIYVTALNFVAVIADLPEVRDWAMAVMADAMGRTMAAKLAVQETYERLKGALPTAPTSQP